MILLAEYNEEGSLVVEAFNCAETMELIDRIGSLLQNRSINPERKGTVG